jgi:hypothetical protein
MAALSTMALIAAIGYGVYSSEQSRKEAKKAQKEQARILEESKPDAPIATGVSGDTSIRRKSIRSGRGGDILAGPLVPRRIGRPTLGGAAV